MSKPKQIPGIDCDAPATVTIQTVLIGRLQEMCALRERALGWGDPEGVHDMRVASRRLRSALRDFMPYMRKRRLSASLRNIKKVADTLGHVRDQDVAIMALEKLTAKAPPEAADGIHGLAEMRRRKLAEARKDLISILTRSYLRQLQADFLPAITAATKAAPVKKQPGRTVVVPISFREAGCATILARLEELEKLGDCLYFPLKYKPLHKMRIAAKRLRYVMELFEQCFGHQLAPFSSRVAALQSSLGELHDCDLWIMDLGESLSKRRSQPASAGPSGDSDPRTGSLWLLDHFVKLRTKHLRDALRLWREWEAGDFSAQLRQVVRLEPPKAASTSAGSVGRFPA